MMAAHWLLGLTVEFLAVTTTNDTNRFELMGQTRHDGGLIHLGDDGILRSLRPNKMIIYVTRLKSSFGLRFHEASNRVPSVTMARDEFTPWHDQKELLAVGKQLFSGNRKGEPDQRDQACKLVSAWRARGQLPHAVDATALLTEAILVDEHKVLNPVATRLLYSGAFGRFVTGLVDTGQRPEQGSGGPRISKMSMYNRAKQLKFPESFVGLRHQATHEDMPTLASLRQATAKALEWLWFDYWRQQYPPIRSIPLTIGTLTKGDAPLNECFKKSLRSYHEYLPIHCEYHALPKLNEKAAETCLDLVRICKGDEGFLRELASVLIESFIVSDSNGTNLGKSIDRIFVLWDPLILKLCSHQQPFFKALTDQMAIKLASPSGPMDISIDRYREVVTLWLEHIFASKVYATTTKRAKYDINHILSTCCNCQNHWTVQLAHRIMAAPGYENTKAKYRERVKDAIPHLAAGPEPAIWYRTAITSQEVEDPVTGEKFVEESEHLEEEELEPGGWARANKKMWKPMPFGNIIH